MKEIRRVLAAIDLGPNGDAPTPGSRRALVRAAWVAQKLGASLVLLHSRTQDEYWDHERESFVHGTHDDAGPAALERICDDLKGQGIETQLVIRSGSAWLSIVREVLREDIDLVVAAKRTHSAADGRQLGTVARRLLRQCPCLVWLEDAQAETDPGVVLAATDLSGVGDDVVDLAAGVADAFGATLHVVHAFSLSMEAQMQGDGARDDFIEQKTREATAHIQGLLADTPCRDSARLHVGLTSPTQAILEGMRALHPELLVMGTVSRGGVAGLLMGNTAERLVDRVECALLALKPHDFVCPVAADDEG